MSQEAEYIGDSSDEEEIQAEVVESEEEEEEEEPPPPPAVPLPGFADPVRPVGAHPGAAAAKGTSEPPNVADHPGKRPSEPPKPAPAAQPATTTSPHPGAPAEKKKPAAAKAPPVGMSAHPGAAATVTKEPFTPSDKKKSPVPEKPAAEPSPQPPGAGGETTPAQAMATTPTDSWNVARLQSTGQTAQAAIINLEQQYHDKEEECERLRSELQQTKAALDSTKADCRTAQSALQASQQRESTLTSAQQQVEQLQQEKKQWQETVSRSAVTVDKLRQEMSELSKSNQELKQSLTQQQVSTKVEESQVIPLMAETRRLQAELDTLQQHTTWLDKELREQQAAHLHEKQTSRDRQLQLQLQLDTVCQEKDGAQAQVEALQSVEHQLQSKLDQVSRDLLQGKQELATSQAEAAQQLADERQLVELQKVQVERWTKMYEDVERNLKHLQQASEEAAASHQQEREKDVRDLEQKYKAILDDQKQAYEAKLAQQKEQGSLALPAAVGQDDDEEDEEEEEESLLSLTDMYARLSSVKSQLRAERRGRKLAQDRLDGLMKSIQNQAPRMQRQKEEYEQALELVDEKQKNVDETLDELQSAREECRQARQEASRYQQQLKHSKEEAKLLGTQVQTMLVARSGGIMAEVEKHSHIPTSIQEMQNQNLRLLSEQNQWKQQVAELERQLRSDTVHVKLERAESELEQLRKDRQQQQVMVSQLVQQRDIYRSLANENGVLGSDQEEISALEWSKKQTERAKELEAKNRDLEGSLAAAKSETDRLSREKETLSERVSRYELHTTELTQGNSKLERDLMTANSGVARAEAESKYHQDKCERLEDSLQRSREQVQQVINAKNELQRINTELQQSISNANAEQSRLDGDNKQLGAKLRLAETQAETAKASESRLIEENKRLRADAARQEAVADSVHRIESSLLAKNETEKEKLMKDIERLTQLQTKQVSTHSAEVERLSGRIQDLEASNQELSSSRDKAKNDELKSKKAMLEAQAEKNKLVAQVEALTTQLRTAKRKLGESDDTVDDEVRRVQSMSTELETAKTELTSLKEQVETYQKIAKEKESAFTELSEATEQFKAKQGKELDDSKSLIETMQKDAASKQEIIVELTNDLAGQRSEREKLANELQNEITKLKTQIDNDEKDVEAAKASHAAMKLDIENVRKEASVAQNNYERELAVHSQARTDLRVALEGRETEKRLRVAAEQQVDMIKTEIDQQRDTWAAEKASLQESSAMLEKSVKEAREQNTLLHQQLETLGDIVRKKQTEGTADSESAEGDTGLEKVVSELREIVKVLRSENELLQSQLDSTKRSVDRERATANVAKRSLDEARAELKALQSSQENEATKGSATDAEKLRASEEQLALLHDSNKLLREETTTLRASLSSSQKELSDLKTSAQPAETIKRDFELKVASLEAEKSSLARELEAWKGRVTSLVSKFNQIDPAEHQKVLKECEKLKKEVTSQNAWKKTMEEENTRIRSIASKINKQLKEQRTQNEALNKQVAELTAEKASSVDQAAITKERDELKAKLGKLEEEAGSVKTELQGANDRNDKLRERLRQFQKQNYEMKSKEKAVADELVAVKAELDELKASAKAPPPPQAASAPPASSVEDTQMAVEPKLSAPTPAEPHEEPASKEEVLPSVPASGFKFGPSAASARQGRKLSLGTSQTASSAPPDSTVEKPAAAKPKDSQLRADAPTFAPKPSAPASQEGAAPEPTAKTEAPSTSEPAAAAPAPPAQRRGSSEAREMNMKEKLLQQKKRKLEELRKKKAELLAQAKAASPEQPKKRAKVDEEAEPQPSAEKETEPAVVADTKEAAEEQVPTAEPAPEPSEEKPAKEADSSVPSQEGTDKGEVVTEAQAEAETEEADEVVEEPTLELVADKGPEKKTEAAPTMAFGSSSTAVPAFGQTSGFGMSSTTTFGQLSKSSMPTTFGTAAAEQSTGSAGFGGTTSSTGSSFLELKPPSSMSTTPKFSFGDTSGGAIKLPTPATQQPTSGIPSSSPFGVFGSGSGAAPTFGSSPFGTMGGGGATSSSSAMPLFGAPAPAPAQPPQQQQQEEDEDDAGQEDDEDEQREVDEDAQE